MKKPSDPNLNYRLTRNRILGVGERTVLKSYYPQLQQRIEELEQFRFLLDRAGDIILLFDVPDGKIRDFNRTTLRVTGYGGDQLRALTVDELFPYLDFKSKIASNGFPGSDPRSPGSRR